MTGPDFDDDFAPEQGESPPLRPPDHPGLARLYAAVLTELGAPGTVVPNPQQPGCGT